MLKQATLQKTIAGTCAAIGMLLVLANMGFLFNWSMNEDYLTFLAGTLLLLLTTILVFRHAKPTWLWTPATLISLLIILAGLVMANA